MFSPDPHTVTTSSEPSQDIDSFFVGGGERFELQSEDRKIAILNNLATTSNVYKLKLFQINAILCHISFYKLDWALPFLTILNRMSLLPSHYHELAQTGQFDFYKVFLIHLAAISKKTTNSPTIIRLLKCIAQASLSYLNGLYLPPVSHQLSEIYFQGKLLDINDAAYNGLIISLCTSFSNIQMIFSTNIDHFKHLIRDNLNLIISKEFKIDFVDATRLITLLNNHKELTDDEKKAILSKVTIGAPSPSPCGNSPAYSATDTGPGGYF